MKVYYTLSDSLAHHGIKGQKWGRRRYQNPDGSLTALGAQRYLNDLTRQNRDSYAALANLKRTKHMSDRDATNFTVKGKIDKALDSRKKAADAEKQYNAELKNKQAIEKEIGKTLSFVENQGYAWKTSKSGIEKTRNTAATSSFMTEHGKLSMDIVVNRASGTKFKVRDKVSDTKRNKWSTKHNMHDINLYKYQ